MEAAAVVVGPLITWYAVNRWVLPRLGIQS